jgi:dTDP-4-dehydrorhamnose 3,5-epimerase-like enzyme
MGSALGIVWPLPVGPMPLLSGKDQQWPTLAEGRKR